MSFARFSSDDFTSDIYAYVDSASNLITVHVAAGRHEFDRSELPVLDSDTHHDVFVEQWLDRHVLLMEKIRGSEVVAYDMPYAGDSYYNLTVDEAVEFVQELEALGYHIPDQVVESMQENKHEVEVSSEVSQRTVHSIQAKNDLQFDTGFLEELAAKRNTKNTDTDTE